MVENALLIVGTVGAIAAIALLRLSWSRPRRSTTLNALGWFLIAASLAAGWAGAGAWGMSVIALWAMGAAFVALAVAAWRSPPARRKASSDRAGMLPEAGESWHFGRRCATFLLVVLAGMIAAIALAIATRWAALLIGAVEADANVLALFVAPLGWTILTFLILMADSRRGQLGYLAVSLATAIPAVATGSFP